MKKTYIILAIMLLGVLASCGGTGDAKTDVSADKSPSLETNTDKKMAELTGNVVLDTNHALA